MQKRISLPTLDDFFLTQQLAESREVVKKVAQFTGDKPLIVSFSGGKDSMALVGLVREVTDNFVCAYMVSGIEFQECIDFVVDVCRKFGWKLMFSHPEIYKGTFFDRLERFQYWPTIRKLWCQRDLKVRPQHLTLVRDFGEGSYYKLNGVRRHESTRRKFLYDNDVFIRRDTNCGGVDYEVFPILRWSDQDIINYLRIAGLPTSGLYKRFVVSGCYWCPWYQADIYYGIAKELPNLYDPMIAWESKIGPSVNGHIYLRDIKQAAMSGRPCPKSRDVRTAKNIVCAEQGCLL